MSQIRFKRHHPFNLLFTLSSFRIQSANTNFCSKFNIMPSSGSQAADELMFTINRLKQVQHLSAAVVEQIREYEQTYLDMQRFDKPVSFRHRNLETDSAVIAHR